MTKLLILQIALLTSIVACSSDESSDTKATIELPSPPDSWTSFDEGSFSFIAPSTFISQEPQGIDSQVGEFLSDPCLLTYDYGVYSSNFESLSDEENFVEYLVTIDGFQATHITTILINGDTERRFMAGIYFSDLGESGIFGNPLSLKMSLYCDTLPNRDAHVAILNSIDF